ncbi:hypothetical protein DV515_00008945 [Chloebia gouldiae]|uniref:Uncharacterized protein n=1 Tax=Chloebia gouldiae TaxID=44316 RepID=A0A3L8SDH1_CHLGU|nr:hypothetical protein DV515_00008945 [Chloebia gouldiae]
MGLSSCPAFTALPSPQEISGWYYLLGEDLGRTKHLKVAMRRLKQSTDLGLIAVATLDCLGLVVLPGCGGAEAGTGQEVKPGSQSAAQESQDTVTLQQLKVGVTGLRPTSTGKMWGQVPA